MRHSRVYVSRSHPEASGVCDECGRRFNRSVLKWQYDWAGASLVNKRLLKCWRCLDEPSVVTRAITIRPDGLPIADPRPRDWTSAETDYVTDESGNLLTDESGASIIKDEPSV